MQQAIIRRDVGMTIMPSALHSKFECDKTAAFGSPVLPEVNKIIALSSGCTSSSRNGRPFFKSSSECTLIL